MEKQRHPFVDTTSTDFQYSGNCGFITPSLKWTKANNRSLFLAFVSRIPLIRALLKNSPILLLDEFNAALDVECQQLLSDILKTHFANKAVVTVAHRINSVIDSDLILVMEKGQLKESGKHDEL